METGLGPGVAVDDCHLEFVKGLIKSHKPKNILELGVGSGKTTVAIVDAVKYNETGDILPGYETPTVTLVDNWHDWGGTRPKCADELGTKVKLVEKDELNFVFGCRERYDFIFSDADHWNTDKWFDYVYDRLLEENGVLMYHDVSLPENFPQGELRFPNLTNILMKCKQRGISHVHFDRSSLKTERCYRGLLCIFKSQLKNMFITNNSVCLTS
jgi:predicted O-methyltransferase YrrM